MTWDEGRVSGGGTDAGGVRRDVPGTQAGDHGAHHTTYAIERLRRTQRNSLKIRGHFPNDEAASKLLYLALRNAVVKLGAPKDSKLAMQHILLFFGTACR